MYRVITSFIDTKDGGYFYDKNDDKRNVYPREGYEPDEERIKVLTSKNNSYGMAFIEEVKEEKEMTVKEIKARLDEKGVKYKSGDTKDELLELLSGE